MPAAQIGRLQKGMVINMYKIALCDDKIKELDIVENILESYRKQHSKCDFSIKRFSSADELLRRVNKKEYVPDLLFIDIYMPGQLGIEAAKELRKMGNECYIVFLTISKEYALEAFGVDAIQYLLKPVSYKEIFRILDRFIKEMNEKENQYLLLKVEGNIKRIALNDIAYCEAQKKQQCIYMTDEKKLLLNMTMTKLYEMLYSHQEFIKVGISYIVNLEHVIGLNTQELQMDNGKKIHLPRGAYRRLREQYFDYYCQD